MERKNRKFTRDGIFHHIQTMCLGLFAVFVLVTGVHADSASYFYDDLGRLTRVVRGNNGVIYDYDEVGNLFSTTSATTSGGNPTITAIVPNVFFVGSKVLATISGQNLLLSESVTCSGKLLSINAKKVTDTEIIAEITALSAGKETVVVTSKSAATATTDVMLVSSKIFIYPGQLALTPGKSGTLTATISPAITVPVNINVRSSAPFVATVPQSVTIPVSGSASFTVTSLQTGIAIIDAGAPHAVVFVANPFLGDPGDKVLGRGTNVSVMIDSASGSYPTSSHQVSVAVDPPFGAVPAVPAPVSVAVDPPFGTVPAVPAPVSVAVDPPFGTVPAVPAPVSVVVDPPLGAVPAVPAPVSVVVDPPFGTVPAVPATVSVAVDPPFGTVPAVPAPVSVAVDPPLGAVPAVPAPVSVVIDSLDNFQPFFGGVSVKIQ